MTIEEIKEKYKDIPFSQSKHKHGGLLINDVTKSTTFSIDYVEERHEYGGCIESLIEQEIIEETYEPLYLEEDLVPSQFFGLDDYLNTKI